MSTSTKLIDLYKSLLHRSIDAVKHRSLKLKELLLHAKEKTAEVEQIAMHELEEVSNYLERDLHEFASHMENTSYELRNWIRFELDLVEEDLLQRLLDVADPTKLALLKLEQQANQVAEYSAGEVTTVGTLQCIQCGAHLHFYKTEVIPLCSQCQGSKFNRILQTEQDD